jgi:UDP-galactopyranose mutase
MKHLTGQVHAKTSLVYEYPRADGDPYYPVPQPANAALYKRYQALAEATPGVHFVGRLATYRYYNMDQVVAQALAVFSRLMGKQPDCPSEVATHAPLIPPALDGAERTPAGDVGRNGVHRQSRR